MSQLPHEEVYWDTLTRNLWNMELKLYLIQLMQLMVSHATDVSRSLSFSKNEPVSLVIYLEDNLGETNQINLLWEHSFLLVQRGSFPVSPLVTTGSAQRMKNMPINDVGIPLMWKI